MTRTKGCQMTRREVRHEIHDYIKKHLDLQVQRDINSDGVFEITLSIAGETISSVSVDVRHTHTLD